MKLPEYVPPVTKDSRPAWLRSGLWRLVSPGRVACVTCGKVYSTNALARSNHLRSCTPRK